MTFTGPGAVNARDDREVHRDARPGTRAPLTRGKLEESMGKMGFEWDLI